MNHSSKNMIPNLPRSERNPWFNQGIKGAHDVRAVLRDPSQMINRPVDLIYNHGFAFDKLVNDSTEVPFLPGYAPKLNEIYGVVSGMNGPPTSAQAEVADIGNDMEDEVDTTLRAAGPLTTAQTNDFAQLRTQGKFKAYPGGNPRFSERRGSDQMDLGE